MRGPQFTRFTGTKVQTLTLNVYIVEEARKRLEEEVSARDSEVKSVLAWPSALSDSASFHLSKCGPEHTLRKLVEECSTTG